MFSGFIRAALVTIGLVSMHMAGSGTAEARALKSSEVNVGSATSVPYGWVDFCNRRPEECNVEELQAVDVPMTSKTFRDLNRINQQVNAFIEPVSNLEHWGTLLDHWDYPTDGKGDCKIYALYKRKLLMQMGYPRQALLMTVVRDLQGNGHAILTVKTNKGDFILDNLNEDVRTWNETGYTYVKRQSQENPNVWLSLGDVVGGQMTLR